MKPNKSTLQQSNISRNKNKKRKFKEKENFNFPEWMECTWRRLGCGKDACLICGKTKKQKQAHIDRGEDLDDIEEVTKNVGQNLKDVLMAMKNDIGKTEFSTGVLNEIDKIEEPPEPEKFPLYNEVMMWHKTAFGVADEAFISGQVWVDFEYGLDFTWYANLLPAKVYRQLCNRWMIEHGDDYGENDYKYTDYVIKESISILKNAILEPVSLGEGPIDGCHNDVIDKKTERIFLYLYSELSRLEGKIKEI
ncbi:MAG: hypothetical protein COV29_03210 [Candidatus Yanofskybacteria bacterium CG10_big_fil_rev_8_21_14_0_10_36_16]|uniref:Uncharacterized protein n=1 Tax=Candidatus Yanofskybacteria bacterium CG10_big_fil_rev_8_21_14_0_10_36_16 TaxID=1975096 RepID=A0A2J0Q6Z1_9BACT|nr:MAG: hypothetical protein COV29_03210 [Candidatus Yanofskybacteria bacterium CG10_big_fil_rev_8_21_14_0_10_36_16]